MQLQDNSNDQHINGLHRSQETDSVGRGDVPTLLLGSAVQPGLRRHRNMRICNQGLRRAFEEAYTHAPALLA
jgi:hypothetical protein